MRACHSLLLIMLAFAVREAAFAAEPPCAPAIAELVSAQGSVEIRRLGEAKWQPASLGDTLCAGDRVRVKERSRAALALSNEIVMRLDEKTTVTLLGVEAAQPSLLELCRGALHFFTRYRKTFRVITPFVNAAVEGTELSIDHGDVQDNISVYEGEVRATNEPTRLLPETCEELPKPAPIGGSLILTSGESAVLPVNQAPSKLTLVARPEDAVQWALYYPPIVDYGFEDVGAPGTALRESIELYRQGKLTEAISRIDKIPEVSRDSRFLTYRAGLLLLVGRVDEARPDIEQALKLDPRNSDAYALKAIISVVQNQKDEALALGLKAVELDPKSSAARIALSYVQQANFQIEQALASVKEAIVALDPKNALAWARLAELEMSTGNLDRALEAAERAVSLNPNLARTQTVLGFAHLTRIETQAAKTSFNKAIELDQADPLPRLGLGLAKIRESDLEEGRREIEIATSLDPASSLTRSYLGKAYYEEKRDEFARTQYELAKALDPRDPTPWFYDAIRKQTENRPVEALQDLERSIELNDNRAVYRSRLLLDQDLAARSASLGRIYSDLGFEQLALVEGWKSVNADPANHSAHRLLADSYSAVPRHEIARVSELLQSQLLQPLNISPIQPQLAEAALLIVEGAGPSSASLNEFNPLFARQRTVLQASGIVGNNSTVGDDFVASGIEGPYSISLGQFHYETNGFRENNGLNEDIYTLFVQRSLSPRTSLQAEYRRRERDRGDLTLHFDPTDFSRDFRETLDADIARIGFRHDFSVRSTIIGSAIFQSLDIEQTEPISGAPNQERQTTRRRDGYIAEVQHLLRAPTLNLISGTGYINHDINESEQRLIAPTRRTIPISSDNQEDSYATVYTYAQVNPWQGVTATVGLNADELRIGRQTNSRLNPKLGLIWESSRNTAIRVAAFRATSRTLTFNQIIEPVQVAGFNQFFDDIINGTTAWRYGLAVDHKLTARISAGLEYSERQLEVPVLGTQSARFFDWEERLGRVYLYWAANPRLALSAEYEYERFDRDRPAIAALFTDGIDHAQTHRLPLNIAYFHPAGFFFRVTASYFNQSGNFVKPVPPSNNVVRFSGSDDFWVFDANVGYRLPKRQGIVSVGVRNLFDEEFLFHETDRNNPRIIPERLVFARLTLTFW